MLLTDDKLMHETAFRIGIESLLLRERELRKKHQEIIIHTPKPDS